MKRLEEKVAIVTGAATGLGREIAKLYGDEGAKVVVSDIRAEEAEETVGAIRNAGGDAVFLKTDVSKSGDVQALIKATEDHYGKLDIMTANAGIVGRSAGRSLVETSEQDFTEVIAVNFDGVWLSFKYAIPAILRAGGGAMSATASLAAHRGYANLAAYCASKGAVVALVRSLAAELAPAIRVNAVSAGAMATELPRHTAEAMGVDLPQVESIVEKRYGRVADPMEVAYAHLFLVSDESSFVNGQALLVDGGRSIIPA